MERRVTALLFALTLGLLGFVFFRPQSGANAAGGAQSRTGAAAPTSGTVDDAVSPSPSSR